MSTAAFSYGFIPTAGQWDLLFNGKQDAIGFVPFNRAGGTLLGKLTLTPSSGTAAGLNIAPGVVPLSPVNGDVWVTQAGIYVRINGQTIGPLGNASGSGSSTVVPTALTLSIGYRATEAIAAGAPINIYSASDGVPSIRNADCNTSDGSRSADGFILAAAASGAMTVQVFTRGENTALSGLTPGATYYLGPGGMIASTPASASGAVAQSLGKAESATTLIFVPGPAIPIQ